VRNGEASLLGDRQDGTRIRRGKKNGMIALHRACTMKEAATFEAQGAQAHQRPGLGRTRRQEG
jgi:hypothetical protein